MPVKFHLRNAGGQPVPSAVAQWLAPAKGGAITAAVDEGLFIAPGASGTAYRFDASARQYVFKWSSNNLATGTSAESAFSSTTARCTS